MKKLLVLVPEADHERIRKLAFENNTSMADIVRQAITQFLENINEEG